MPYLNFIIFPLVGAVIGAVTNDIAIRMLFRPYKPIKIGKFTLPFTPGVIPSQRRIIANNIAMTFEKNLLSGDEIHQIIIGDKVKVILRRKVSEFIESKLGLFSGFLKDMIPEIVQKIVSGIEEMADQAIGDGGDLHIAQKIEQKINDMDIATLEELILGISKKQFKHITFFGAILGFVIGLVQATLSLII
jgi:uncharacterized membrane protein YheB (UPF0754 family)